MHDAEDGNRGPSPQVRMVVHRHHVVTLTSTVRDAGLDLERDTQRRDPGLVRKVNIDVFADILLLVDLLKPASMVLEEQPRHVDAIPAGDARGIYFAPSHYREMSPSLSGTRCIPRTIRLKTTPARHAS